MIGSAYAATLILFVLANKLTTSANTIFLQSTAPLYLLLLGPLVLREPIRRVDILLIAAVGTGALLLLVGAQRVGSTAPNPRLGNILALFAGFAWALTLTGLRWVGKRDNSAESPGLTVMAGNVIAFAACLAMAVPVSHIAPLDVGLLLYLGVFQIGFAYFALTCSISQVPGLEASTLLLLEPALNPIWTWLVHREQPGVFAIVGGLLIILATFASTLWRTRMERRVAV